MNYHHPDSDFYRKVLDSPPPSVSTHGTEDEVRDNLKPLKTWGWKLEGDQLSCETNMGKLVQKISPDYICLGDDPNGMPLLKKINV